MVVAIPPTWLSWFSLTVQAGRSLLLNCSHRLWDLLTKWNKLSSSLRLTLSGIISPTAWHHLPTAIVRIMPIMLTTNFILATISNQCKIGLAASQQAHNLITTLITRVIMKARVSKERSICFINVEYYRHKIISWLGIRN